MHDIPWCHLIRGMGHAVVTEGGNGVCIDIIGADVHILCIISIYVIWIHLMRGMAALCSTSGKVNTKYYLCVHHYLTPTGHLLAHLPRNSLFYAALPGIVTNILGIKVIPTRDLHCSRQKDAFCYQFLAGSLPYIILHC